MNATVVEDVEHIDFNVIGNTVDASHQLNGLGDCVRGGTMARTNRGVDDCDNGRLSARLAQWGAFGYAFGRTIVGGINHVSLSIQPRSTKHCTTHDDKTSVKTGKTKEMT
jgi:hypothetical protein